MLLLRGTKWFTRNRNVCRQGSRNWNESNKNADLLEVVPKGQPEGLSEMVVDER